MSPRIHLLTLAGLVACGLCARGAETQPAAYDVWRQPQAWPRHMQLRSAFIQTLQRGDTAEMERVSKAGVDLLPDDPTWRYNHACALAYREKTGPALNELQKAVRLGFRDAAAIERDSDLAPLRDEPRFREIVAEARSLADAPVPGRPSLGPCYASYGGTAVLTATNVCWNFDTGLFEAAVSLSGQNAPSALAANYGKSRIAPNDCPERPYMAAWLSEGTAAGNGGDFYMNRDRGHSPLATGDFPLLTTLRLAPPARTHGVDLDLPNLTLRGRPTLFGNASRARVKGPLWRSNARAAMLDPYAAAHMNDLYLANQFWVFPAHMDFGRAGIGDVFPARTPHTLATVGSSFSDQPYLRAAVAAAAAMPRPTKTAVVRCSVMGPTLQWLLRRTQKGVESEADYLTARAHPVAFDAKALDPVRTVTMAHALRPLTIPPIALLTIVNSKLFPIPQPQPVRDYPDPNVELIFATPTAVAYTLRGLDAIRTFIFSARVFPERPEAKETRFAWRVVGGDASAVKIAAPLGETLASPETGIAQITIDRTHVTNRIDVAVFAKVTGTEYGAPSFISFLPVPFEERVYDGQGRLVSIDNTNSEGRYTDPLIALPRTWKDTFTYAPNGALTGYVRTLFGKEIARFTATGERIVSTRADGSPDKTVPVRYIPRQMRGAKNPNLPPDLTFVDATPGEP